MDEGSPADIVKDLAMGDAVIYRGNRGIFNGVNAEGMAVITLPNTLTNYVPPNLYYKIKPYYGNAKTLGGRGVRGEHNMRLKFLRHLLDVEQSQIPSQITRSVVIVCEKRIADDIANDTIIEFEEGRKVPLRSVFASAYYTPNEIIHYAGNSSKTEPVLKFTSRISVARELVMEDTDRSIIGMVVNGNAILEAGISELMNLLSRRSLRSVWILTRIDSGNSKMLLEQFPEIKLFAWTPSAISALNQGCDMRHFGVSNGVLRALTENTLKRSVELVKVASPICSERYLEAKKRLIRIARNEYSSHEKESFVMVAFSLLNLLTYSIFSMRSLENIALSSGVVVSSPRAQVEQLAQIFKRFTGGIAEDMQYVGKVLSEMYENLYDQNPKNETIIRLLAIKPRSKRVAIVVPKPYYCVAFSASFPADEDFAPHVTCVPITRFESEKLYDDIIVAGTFTNKNFDPFFCTSSATIQVLTYEVEQHRFRSNSHSAQKLLCYYDDRSSGCYQYDEFVEKASVDLESKSLELDMELTEYINAVSVQNAIASVRAHEDDGQPRTEVVRVIKFETGENILLSKNYVPYLFEPTEEIVKETTVDRLAVGDILVFASKNDEARDIVNEILHKLVTREKANSTLTESYRKARYWKEVMRAYMEANTLSFKDLARIMMSFGHSRHEVTIRSWLDEASHIVGPRDVESFQIIAQITGDQQMLNSADDFCEACNYIRSTRVRILKYLGRFIINSISRSSESTDELFSSVAGEVADLAVTLQVASVVDVKDLSVPIQMANRVLRQM